MSLYARLTHASPSRQNDATERFGPPLPMLNGAVSTNYSGELDLTSRLVLRRQKMHDAFYRLLSH